MRTRFLSIIALAFFAAGSVSAASLTIDDFQTTQAPVCVGPFVFCGGPPSADQGVSGLGMIGGARNIQITRSGGTGFDYVTVNPLLFELSTSSADNGYGRVIWDGDTNNTLNFAGLGGVDLSLGGSNPRFRVRARSDIAGTGYITIFTSATEYSTVSFNLPAGGFGVTPFTEYSLYSSMLTQGAPLLVMNNLGLAVATSMATSTNINAITLFIDGTGATSAGLDAQFQLLEVTDVPEPATFGLVGGVLLAAAFMRRQRS